MRLLQRLPKTVLGVLTLTRFVELHLNFLEYEQIKVRSDDVIVLPHDATAVYVMTILSVRSSLSVTL